MQRYKCSFYLLKNGKRYGSLQTEFINAYNGIEATEIISLKYSQGFHLSELTRCDPYKSKHSQFQHSNVSQTNNTNATKTNTPNLENKGQESFHDSEADAQALVDLVVMIIHLIIYLSEFAISAVKYSIKLIKGKQLKEEVCHEEAKSV